MFRFVASVAVLLCTSGVTPAIAQSPTQVAASSTQDIRLERSGATRIPLVPANARPGDPGRSGFQISLPRGNRQVYLVLRNIFAESAPGVGYDVYLNLPAGRPPEGRSDPHYVGTIHFFDTSRGHAREARLDITEKLKMPAAERESNATPSVTVVPAATARADAQIGSVAIEAE
jgi:hypothetical protein